MEEPEPLFLGLVPLKPLPYSAKGIPHLRGCLLQGIFDFNQDFIESHFQLVKQGRIDDLQIYTLAVKDKKED